MDNEALKEVFINLHKKIVNDVNPDSIIDTLLSKRIISTDDYHELRQVQGSRNRCRDLLSRLYRSSHPQTFIQLRRALLNRYPSIVDEIDQQQTSLSARQPQPRQGHSTDGQFLLK